MRDDDLTLAAVARFAGALCATLAASFVFSTPGFFFTTAVLALCSFSLLPALAVEAAFFRGAMAAPRSKHRSDHSVNRI